jgi:hypothetical protein
VKTKKENYTTVSKNESEYSVSPFNAGMDPVRIRTNKSRKRKLGSVHL